MCFPVVLGDPCGRIIWHPKGSWLPIENCCSDKWKSSEGTNRTTKLVQRNMTCEYSRTWIPIPGNPEGQRYCSSINKIFCWNYILEEKCKVMCFILSVLLSCVNWKRFIDSYPLSKVINIFGNKNIKHCQSLGGKTNVLSHNNM